MEKADVLTDEVIYIAFILAQVLGGLVGAALIYAIYFGAIDIYEGAGVRTQATAGIFATYSVSVLAGFAVPSEVIYE